MSMASLMLVVLNILIKLMALVRLTVDFTESWYAVLECCTSVCFVLSGKRQFRFFATK